MILLFTSSTLKCGLVGGLDVDTELFKAINIMGSSPIGVFFIFIADVPVSALTRTISATLCTSLHACISGMYADETCIYEPQQKSTIGNSNERCSIDP